MKKEIQLKNPVLFSRVVSGVQAVLHKPRRLRLTWILITLIMFTGLIGLLTSELKDPTGSQYEEVLAGPFFYQNHLILAQKYLAVANIPAAQAEIHIAQELAQTRTNILGTNDQITKLEQALKQAIQNPNQELEFWQKITSQYPAYKDGLLNLAILSYNRQDFKTAQKYLTGLRVMFPDIEYSLPGVLQDLLVD